MFRNILVMLDNSDYSMWAVDRSIDFAKTFDGKLVGAHVYAAKLHEQRFVQMEPGLPAEYQEPAKLQEQRDIHGELIEKGLKIISDSYLDVFNAKCSEEGIGCDGKTMEGRNYAELVKDISASEYDLVAMGAKGLGEVPTTQIGSVCERVTRRINVDSLIMKAPMQLKGGHVVVGIDGSEQSFAAMRAAIAMGKHLGAKITAITVFDPDFHYKAFDSIAKVLSEEAGKLFRFEQQEKLHNEIIDSGLEKIYRDHLEQALEMARHEGVEVEPVVLAGKPYDMILQWLDSKEIALLLLGKIGVHGQDELDIGSNSENLLRNARCNVMLVSRKVKPGGDGAGNLAEEEPMDWDAEAIELLERVPGFVRNMVRGHMEAQARKAGDSRITAQMMKDARGKMGM
ncbi:MAG: universal stress protein [Nitrospinota bacterium]|nr:universal stress protein [Nitrospinota bacterium]